MCHTAYWGRYDGEYRSGATNFISFLETKGPQGFYEFSRYIVSPFQDYNHHFNTTIVDYHDRGGDVVETFFCNPILNASNACNRKRAMGSADVGYNRVSAAKDLLLYDEITMAAYGAGLLNVSRPVAQNRLREYHESQNGNQTKARSALPMICPSEETLNEILQLSLRAESEFSPHPISKEELGEKFEEVKLKGSFCAVNTTMIMEDAKWRKVFAEINAKSE